jgi:protein-S-isoprenylcysteine O-methyltransferase Ste14
VLIVLGVALLLGSMTPFALAPAFALLMDRVFIAPEERMREQPFRGAYRDYKSRVRRWV